MKRSVVKHGNSTFIISLPIRWVKEHNIEKGTELDVNEDGSKIILSTEEEKKPIEVNIDITGLDRTSIMYALRGFYRLGYDTLNITFNNPTTAYLRKNEEVRVISVIHKEVDRLMGFEVVREKEKSCVIKDLQAVSEKEFDQILERVFVLLLDTAKDFFEGINTNNIPLLLSVEGKHDSITKFVSYCLRLLNKKGYAIARKTPYYYHIIALLDKITDIMKYGARDAISYNKKLCPETIRIIDIVIEDLKSYHELFYNYDNEKVAAINSNRYAAETILNNLPDDVRINEIMIASGMFSTLEILLDMVEARTALEY